MKKLLSFALALILALSLTVTAFATSTPGGTGNTDETKSTTVKFSVAPTYTVTIPENIPLQPYYENGASTGRYTGTASIKVDKLILLESKALAITLASDFKLSVPQSESYFIPYEVRLQEDAEPITSEAVVASFVSGNAQQSQTLYFATTEKAEYAGDFSDTVTFTISVVDKQTEPAPTN